MPGDPQRINAFDTARIIHRLRERAPQPPTESPLEDAFILSAEKYLSPLVTFAQQVPVRTAAGNFRLDALVSGPKGRVGIELDGKAYHEVVRDNARDHAILEADEVDLVVRIPGHAMFGYPHIVWLLLAGRVPWMVSDRARMVLQTQLESDLPKDPLPPHVVVSDSAGIVWWLVRRRDGSVETRSIRLTFRQLDPNNRRVAA